MYISSRSAKDCEATAAELNASGPGTCIALPADMQKLEQVEELLRALTAREHALHVLVNNAGAAWGDPIDDYPVRLILCQEMRVCPARNDLSEPLYEMARSQSLFSFQSTYLDRCLTGSVFWSRGRNLDRHDFVVDA